MDLLCNNIVTTFRVQEASVIALTLLPYMMSKRDRDRNRLLDCDCVLLNSYSLLSLGEFDAILWFGLGRMPLPFEPAPMLSVKEFIMA